MERILIVEDDSFFREVFSDLLRQEGYEVEAATSGLEALERLKEKEFHVVVTDLVLEDTSGLDILSRVKQLDPAIEVILVTGHANVETAIFALKNGARDYLVKPINSEELKHTVALCIEQRRLLDENQELKGLVHLFQVSQTIANCLDLERMYSLVVDSLAKEVGVTRGMGYFLDESGNLGLKDVKGFDEALGTKLGEALQTRADWYDAQLGSFIQIKDFFPPDAAPSVSGKHLSDALLLFIRAKTTLQGVVVLFNDADVPFPAAINRKNLTFLLDQSSLAFDNATRYTVARNLLNIDELTGLFNYRYLEIAMEREIKRAERYGSTLSVIFLDLDQFKDVNDTYGHLIGSKVLKEVGMLLKRSVREVDTVIRYGGDEYTVILIETSVATAAAIAERIRTSIEGHSFLADEGLNIRVTASLGYACYPEDAKTKVDLLELADKAMYHGKYSGKNMVFRIKKKKGNQTAERRGIEERGDYRNKGV